MTPSPPSPFSVLFFLYPYALPLLVYLLQVRLDASSLDLRPGDKFGAAIAVLSLNGAIYLTTIV